MSDIEISFHNDDEIQQEKSSVENRIPRSPAVAAYESYAAWRKKKFPPKALDYNADNYISPSAGENLTTTQRQSNFDSKKSSYFPITEDQYNSENNLNHNHPDSRLPRSSHFSLDSENLPSAMKNHERRSFSSRENHQEKYNPNMFQGNDQKLNSNTVRSSYPENKISREAENCLKIYSENSPGFHTARKIVPRPTSQFPGQREMMMENFNKLKKSPMGHNHRSASHSVRHQSDQRHSSSPTCCPVDHKSRESESGEMVKGLLKLIDNQNEQIKNLQAQLDRLLSIHEETLRERAKYPMEISRHNPQICMQAYNAALHAKSAATAITADGYSNQEHSKFPEFNQVSNECSKKALMERKVSIGVMTSFEFTVQNNPFNHDSENQIIEEYEKEETCQETVPGNQDLTLNNKRKANLFSRMPSALENITEDSESHLSSSQQPSSNCLSSCKGGRKGGKNCSGTNGNSPNSTNNFTQTSSTNFNRSNENIQSNNKHFQNTREANEFSSPVNYRKQSSPSTMTKTVTQISKNVAPRGSDELRFSRSNEEDENFREKESQENKENFPEESLLLTEEQVQVGDRSPPSPAPSIHIDMQDFSSEEGSVLTKRTPKVGWTFYNNVLGQVNNILQNSPLQDDPRNKKELDKNLIIDTVKAATIDQLTKLGISFADNDREANANKKVTFDTSYYSRLNPEINMMQGSSIMTETSTSMHMKALAMKYLKEEQISEAMQQKQKRDALTNLMVSNVQGTTNMSFATMRYLQRYQLLPESMNGIIEDAGKENFQVHEMTKNRETMPQKQWTNLPSRQPISPATRANCPSKILDISTLKQQPKLL